MKTIKAFVLVIAAVSSFSAAAEDTFTTKCAACHNGTVAPDKQALLGKFKSLADLVAGAKATTNPMMKPVQSDEALLKKAAESLGLK